MKTSRATASFADFHKQLIKASEDKVLTQAELTNLRGSYRAYPRSTGVAGAVNRLTSGPVAASQSREGLADYLNDRGLTDTVAVLESKVGLDGWSTGGQKNIPNATTIDLDGRPWEGLVDEARGARLEAKFNARMTTGEEGNRALIAQMKVIAAKHQGAWVRAENWGVMPYVFDVKFGASTERVTRALEEEIATYLTRHTGYMNG